MHKQYRIATECGVPKPEKERHKRDGDNFQKGLNEKLKVCPKCKLVWEHVAETGHRLAHDDYYPILPRYGKPELICPKCR